MSQTIITASDMIIRPNHTMLKSVISGLASAIVKQRKWPNPIIPKCRYMSSNSSVDDSNCAETNLQQVNSADIDRRNCQPTTINHASSPIGHPNEADTVSPAKIIAINDHSSDDLREIPEGDSPLKYAGGNVSFRNKFAFATKSLNSNTQLRTKLGTHDHHIDVQSSKYPPAIQSRKARTHESKAQAAVTEERNNAGQTKPIHPTYASQANTIDSQHTAFPLRSADLLDDDDEEDESKARVAYYKRKYEMQKNKGHSSSSNNPPVRNPRTHESKAQAAMTEQRNKAGQAKPIHPAYARQYNTSDSQRMAAIPLRSGTLLNDEGDESKARVAYYQGKYEMQKNKLQIEGEVLYGLHPVYLALKNEKRKCFKLFTKQSSELGKEKERGSILEVARSKGIPIFRTNKRMLDIIATGHMHQGVCLDAGIRNFASISDQPDSRCDDSSSAPQLWLLLDYIQDPMNFGAVLRSSFYFGVDKVIVNKDANCRLSPVVSKASAGVLEAMDVYGVSDIPSFLRRQKDNGFVVTGTQGIENRCPSPHTADHRVTVPLEAFEFQKSTVLVIGNEGKGMSPGTSELCDMFLFIPQLCTSDALDSLNVSVATGIILHHLSQLKKKKSASQYTPHLKRGEGSPFIEPFYRRGEIHNNLQKRSYMK